MSKKRIAIIEDDRFLREQIAISLGKEYDIVQAGDRVKGERLLLREVPELALVDLHMPPSGASKEGMKLIDLITTKLPDTLVIVISGDDDMKNTIRAIESGAHDYFKKPFDLTELKLVIGRALQKQHIERENRRLRQELQSRYSFQNIIGQSKAILHVFEAIKRVACSSATVIIRGESGTGKELIARAIHYNSNRKEKPFVSINCAALPESLVETELFGHERGSFTGAVSAHTGRFELAHEGTLFLDEIGSVSPPVQAKLLRVLEEHRFERIGGTRQIHTDVRLITATNEDLEKRVKENMFREDLYYRINVFPIRVPALKERKEDIPILLDYFLQIFCKENNFPLKRFDELALQVLTNYPWKGNVRELENLVQTLVLMNDHNTLRVQDLPSHIVGKHGSVSFLSSPLPEEGIDLDKVVEEYEYQLLKNALQRTDGVKNKAAGLLGIDKNRMKYLSRKHNL